MTSLAVMLSPEVEIRGEIAQAATTAIHHGRCRNLNVPCPKIAHDARKAVALICQ